MSVPLALFYAGITPSKGFFYQAPLGKPGYWLLFVPPRRNERAVWLKLRIHKLAWTYDRYESVSSIAAYACLQQNRENSLTHSQERCGPRQ